jgi:hypothetical protein
LRVLPVRHAWQNNILKIFELPGKVLGFMRCILRQLVLMSPGRDLRFDRQVFDIFHIVGHPVGELMGPVTECVGVHK